MSTSGATLPPHSQWTPKEFRIILKLSADSLKYEVPFFALINMKESGFVIPSSSTFAIVAVKGSIITVQISIRNFGSRPKDHIAFGTRSNLQDVSTACSKLNMADALKCRITASMASKDEVCFSILPSSETVEKKLAKFFSIYNE